MLVGGIPDSAHYRVEMVDLSGQNLRCPPIPQYPNNRLSTGTFIDDEARVCGGVSDTERFDTCFGYSLEVSQMG